MRMPAKSVIEKYEESRALDQIALPLIRGGLHIYEAYQRAFSDCDAQSGDRFPVTRREPPFRLTPPRGKF